MSSPPSPPPVTERMPPGRLARWVILALAIVVAVGLYFRNARYVKPLLLAPEPPPASTAPPPTPAR